MDFLICLYIILANGFARKDLIFIFTAIVESAKITLPPETGLFMWGSFFRVII